jgi:hypothetical protein
MVQTKVHPPCRAFDTSSACRAHVVCRHDEQGWCLPCNGVVLFDDGGAILPDGSTLEPRLCVQAA